MALVRVEAPAKVYCGDNGNAPVVPEVAEAAEAVGQGDVGMNHNRRGMEEAVATTTALQPATGLVEV